MTLDERIDAIVEMVYLGSKGTLDHQKEWLRQTIKELIEGQAEGPGEDSGGGW